MQPFCAVTVFSSNFDVENSKLRWVELFLSRISQKKYDRRQNARVLWQTFVAGHLAKFPSGCVLNQYAHFDAGLPR